MRGALGMVRAWVVFLLVFLLLSALTACGGGGGGGGSGTAPVISSMAIAPNALYEGDGGGEAFVTCTFTFFDPDGNVSTVQIAIYDSAGVMIQSDYGPIEGVGGAVEGEIVLSGLVDTTVPDDYTVSVYLTDAAGLQSNVLEGVFVIGELPWTALAPMPTPRSGHAVVALNGLVYVVGGENYDFAGYDFDPIGTVEIYDPATAIWTTGTPMPTPRKDPVAAVVGGKIYVIGGTDINSPGGTSLVEIYDPASDSWTTGADMPTPRHSAAAAVIAGSLSNGLIYVAGGIEAGMTVAAFEVYDPAADSWTPLPDLPTPRYDLAAASWGDEVYLLGGYYTISLTGYLDVVEVYDPVTNGWRSAAAMPAYLSRFAAVSTAGGIQIFGGQNWARALDLNFSYDATADFWDGKTPIPEVLVDLEGVEIGGKVYILSGLASYEYDPAKELY